MQSADTTGDANSPERRAYVLPSSQSNPVQNNFAWYEHYIGGDNGVGDYQVFDFPVPAAGESPGTAYPGPTNGTGWFIPVGSVWHYNGSNWRFRVPSGSFPDGTLYEVSYTAFVQGTSDATGSSKTAQQHFPPQADSNFWSEENADIHWSAFATYSGGGSIVLYNNRMYSRTGSDVVYVSGGNPTPDQDTGWTDITEDKVSHLLHLPTVTNDDGTHSLVNVFEGQTLDVVFIDAAYKQDIDGTERQFLHGFYHWDADTTNWLYYASTAAILADATTQQATDGIVSIGLYGEDVDGGAQSTTQPIVIKGTGGVSVNLGVQHGTTGFHSEIEIDGSGVSGSGVDVEETFPTTPSIGDQIFLSPAGNAIVAEDNHGNNRPRGLYAYIQPSSDPATRFWEELTIPEVGQLYNDARVGDVIYLTSDEDNFNGLGIDHPAGFYRASVTDENTPFHTTWTAVGGGDTTALQAEVDAVEVEVDNIQAHEDVIDHRLEILESQITNLEQTYAGEYTFVGNTTINALLTGANRRDSQGANPSTTNNILNSEYNPDSNVLRWWIAPNSSETTINGLITNATAVGFNDGTAAHIPFVAINAGINQESTARYIDFKLQQPDTYELTLQGYADDTEVVFDTTLYFFNTANTHLTQADTDAGDHHRANALTPTQEEDLTQIGNVAANKILSTDADGGIVGTDMLSSTDNLSEGTTNLYFTNNRAIDASNGSRSIGPIITAGTIDANRRQGDENVINTGSNQGHSQYYDATTGWGAAIAITNTVPVNVGDFTFNDSQLISAGQMELISAVNGVMFGASGVVINDNALVNVESINGNTYSGNEELALRVDSFGTITNSDVTGVDFTDNSVAVTATKVLAVTYGATPNNTYYSVFTNDSGAWTQRFYRTGDLTNPFHTVQITT